MVCNQNDHPKQEVRSGQEVWLMNLKVQAHNFAASILEVFYEDKNQCTEILLFSMHLGLLWSNQLCCTYLEHLPRQILLPLAANMLCKPMIQCPIYLTFRALNLCEMMVSKFKCKAVRKGVPGVMNTHGNGKVNRWFTDILHTFFIFLLLYTLRCLRMTWCCALGLCSSPFHLNLCFTLTWCCALWLHSSNQWLVGCCTASSPLPIKTYIDCSYSLVCSLFLIHSNTNNPQTF